VSRPQLPVNHPRPTPSTPAIVHPAFRKKGKGISKKKHNQNQHAHRRPSRQTNIILDIKRQLPSDRTPLVHLSDGTCDHTDDPEAMAQIIKKFWGRIWSKRKFQGSAIRARDIDNYLSFYEKSCPSAPEFTPVIPSVAEIQDGLQHTNDSAHGVDGVPFSVYRCLSDITAPLLREMLVFISEGKLPPSDFNCGRLFVLPKDGSSVVDRTRPITVNNADNRIIAKITTNQISPGLNEMIDPSQCGFIPGRNGSTHILSLNTFFYDAIKNTNPAYILLLDTAKAFDSIDHDYLFKLMEKINMPTWVLNVIKGLFHDVFVFPALNGPNSVSIPIQRGVKQGCPLSPLLFALV
jgi:hypothetical protein